MSKEVPRAGRGRAAAVPDGFYEPPPVVELPEGFVPSESPPSPAPAPLARRKIGKPFRAKPKISDLE